MNDDENGRGRAEFQFAEYVLRPERKELLRAGQAVAIGPKPFSVLIYLVHQRDRAISRRELYESIWALPWSERSSANTVDVTVGRLRKILGDGREDKEFIETIHGAFRFLAPVIEARDETLGTGIGEARHPARISGDGDSRISAVRARGEGVKPPVGMALPARRRTRPAFFLLFVLLAATALIYSVSVSRPRGPVSDFRVSGKNIIAVNRRGQELWRYSFSAALDEAGYGEARWRRAWVGALGGGSQAGLLLSVWPFRHSGLGHSLTYFDAAGKVRWQFVPNRVVRDAGGSIMEPPYGIGPFEVVTASALGETRIVVSSYHWLEQADQVAVLSTSGRVLGEYWHPGHLLHLAQADLEGHGRPKVLLGGVNNGDHQATLVILDPWAIQGITTPSQMTDPRFRLLDMPPAKEGAVILFPRSCVSRGQPYTRVQGLRLTPDRIYANVVEGPAEDRHPEIIYEFDYRLHLLKVVPGAHQYKILHEQMQARGELDHRFSPQEFEDLKAGVLVRR